VTAMVLDALLMLQRPPVEAITALFPLFCGYEGVIYNFYKLY
jgi:hypothetical protein